MDQRNHASNLHASEMRARAESANQFGNTAGIAAQFGQALSGQDYGAKLPEPEPEIPALLARGEQIALATHEVINSLETRLSAVLRPSQPIDHAENKTVSFATALGKAIDTTREVTANANARLIELLRRIEL